MRGGYGYSSEKGEGRREKGEGRREKGEGRRGRRSLSVPCALYQPSTSC